MIQPVKFCILQFESTVVFPEKPNVSLLTVCKTTVYFNSLFQLKWNSSLKINSIRICDFKLNFHKCNTIFIIVHSCYLFACNFISAHQMLAFVGQWPCLLGRPGLQADNQVFFLNEVYHNFSVAQAHVKTVYLTACMIIVDHSTMPHICRNTHEQSQ